MKLWVDDIRNAPDESWVVARTINSAIALLFRYPNVSEVSLDHDISHQVTIGALGRPYPCDETFVAVAYFLGSNCGYLHRAVEDYVYPTITIHSSNPVGAKKMQEVLAEFNLESTLKPMGMSNRLEMEV